MTRSTSTHRWTPLVICPNRDIAKKLLDVWPQVENSDPPAEVQAYPSRAELREMAAKCSANLCFLDMGTDRDVALGLTREMRVLGIPVVALHTANDPDLVLSCMRGGAAEFLYPPFQSEPLKAALDRLDKRAKNALAPRSGGEVYCFMPGKSGSGNTTIACNLAYELHNFSQQKVLLADLDPLTGTIAFLLKLNSNYTFVHALANSSRLDDDLWSGLVTPCRGVDVLLSPDMPVDLVYEIEDLAAMVQYWRQVYDYVVMDIPGSQCPWGLELARLSDQLVLVTTNELPAIHATQNTLAYFDHKNFSRSRIRLVVNRYNIDVGLDEQEISAALDLKVLQLLPSDFEAVQKSLMEGKPVPAGTQVGRSITELAENLTGRKRAPKRHSLFGGLFSMFETS